MDNLEKILRYLSIVLLGIYIAGLIIGAKYCSILVYVVIGIPWSTVVVYFFYFMKRRDYLPALGAILILLELGLLVYLRNHLI
ncbi:MAG: hypothetical protein GSR77_07275 [Desulfurococcales archaeon]|nr:hypothetical protein [Desulfurococcales archaeon]